MLNRLLERGLVLEVIGASESTYSAAEPRKLREVVTEKLAAVDRALPSLEEAYISTPSEYRVFTYHGQ